VTSRDDRGLPGADDYDHDLHAGRAVALYVGLEQREVGDWERGEVRIEARLEVADHLRGPGGGVRTGALLTACDNAAGFTAGLAALPDGWVVSTNLVLRVHRVAMVGPLRFDARVLRAGKKAIVTAAEVFDDGAGGVRAADSVLTSAVLVPEFGVPVWDRPAHLVSPPVDGPLPPIVEAFGIEPDANRDGTVTLPVADRLRNPWGIVHGGVTATLADVAGERAVTARTGAREAVTTDAVVHYLAPGRVGPLRASARVLGERPDGHVCRVEIVDTGAADRVVVVAVTTVRPV
jgi:1,4-dihydroxy-2-naphthoyl-CoA hydrolase